MTGPRQVGKTTVLRNCDPDRRYVSLDKLELRALAKENPDLFIQLFPPPVLIDEVHHAPQLLPYIKAIVDEKREKGQRFSFKFPVIQPFTYRCLLLLGFSGRVSFSAPLSNSGWTMWLMV